MTSEMQRTTRTERTTLCCSLPVLLLLTGVTARADTPRPNVLVILADDQGWGDLSLHGNRNLETPVLDRLARDGASFDRFFVCPVCSPTRAEFLTGRYFPRGGVRGVSTGNERLDPAEQTIAEIFREAGYRTGIFGKWHNGTQPPYHPNARGFDEFYGFTSGHWGSYWSPFLDRNGRIVQGTGYLTDDLTNHAMEFIRTSGDQPFFCCVSCNIPHSPMQVPDRWWDRHRDAPLLMKHRDPDKENPDHTRAALAMCENIDWNVGRLLNLLEEQHIADRTIVVYFSDNGPNGYRWNGGMKGRKGSVDEGGVRSVLLMRWPGVIVSGRIVKPIAAAIDLLPTLIDLAGIPRSGTRPLDGRSLKPLLTETDPAWPDRMIASSWARQGISVRSQRFRLDPVGRLFDMQRDPGQRQDVADRYPEQVRKLTQYARWYRTSVLKESDVRPPPFSVGHPSGHPAGRLTQLPVRDAVSSGRIVRSSRHPNSSWFGHWTSPDDTIRWSVRVHEAGTYSAELLYACDTDDAGALIRLEARIGDSVHAVQTRAPAHPSEITGADRDRVPRNEGYEKRWGRLPLGTIVLPAGDGTLQLTAPDIPGRQAIDVRLLLLHRTASPEHDGTDGPEHR